MTILHIGHQPSEVGIGNASLSTTSGDFDPNWDVNGLRVTGDSQSGSKILFDWPSPSGDTIWIQFRFRAPSSSASSFDRTFDWISLNDSSGTTVASVFADNSVDEMFARVYGDSTVTATSGNDHSNNVDYFYALKVVVNTSEVTATMYVNDVLVGSATTTNNGSKSVPTICNIKDTGIHTDISLRDWAYAHFLVTDTDPRGKRFVRLAADVNGAETGWTGDSSVLSDGDVATRISSDTAGQRQSFTTTGPSIPSGTTVAAVHGVVSAQQGSSTTLDIAPFVRIGTTNYDGTAETPVTDGVGEIIHTWTQNPATSSSWTDSNLPDEGGVVSS